MKKKRIKESNLISEVRKLRDLPPGLCDPEGVNNRIEAIEDYLRERAQNEEHLRSIIKRCIRELKWVPVPADVAEIISNMAAELVPVWESRPPLPARTAQDVLDEIKFQKQFAIDYPKLEHNVRARLHELDAELEAMGVAQ